MKRTLRKVCRNHFVQRAFVKQNVRDSLGENDSEVVFSLIDTSVTRLHENYMEKHTISNHHAPTAVSVPLLLSSFFL